MKLIIENTTKIVEVNGVPARVWEGKTESGIEVHCLITRVAVAEGLENHLYKQFETELSEQRKPSFVINETYPIDARMIL